MADTITFEDAHALLDYDCGTGIFRWRTTRPGRPSGKIAGNVQAPEKNRKVARSRIFLKGKSYLSHRLAWFMVHGSWPIGEIDHVDGNSNNNSLANLRQASSSENKFNKSRPISNTSGATGVKFIGRLNKWLAEAWVYKKHYSLGCYSSFDEAVAARDSFCRAIRGEFFKGATC